MQLSGQPHQVLHLLGKMKCPVCVGGAERRGHFGRTTRGHGAAGRWRRACRQGQNGPVFEARRICSGTVPFSSGIHRREGEEHRHEGSGIQLPRNAGETEERTKKRFATCKVQEIPQQQNPETGCKKIHVVPNISLDSCEHFGNDDLVIALRTTVATSVMANRAVAVGQLELPYGN